MKNSGSYCKKWPAQRPLFLTQKTSGVHASDAASSGETSVTEAPAGIYSLTEIVNFINVNFAGRQKKEAELLSPASKRPGNSEPAHDISSITDFQKKSRPGAAHLLILIWPMLAVSLFSLFFASPAEARMGVKRSTQTHAADEVLVKFKASVAEDTITSVFRVHNLVPSRAVRHKVKYGETLGGLARKYMKDSRRFGAIARKNKIRDPEGIKGLYRKNSLSILDLC